MFAKSCNDTEEAKCGWQQYKLQNIFYDQSTKWNLSDKADTIGTEKTVRLIEASTL